MNQRAHSVTSVAAGALRRVSHSLQWTARAASALWRRMSGHRVTPTSMALADPQRRALLGATLAGAGALVARNAAASSSEAESASSGHHRWGMVIDLDRCSGCGACTVACKQENNIPTYGPEATFKSARIEWISMNWEPAEQGGLPQLFPFPCQHCADPPCVKVCPVGATYKDPDGITYQIWDRCIGCRYCMVACPYSRRSFNWAHPHWDGTEVQLLNPDVATRPEGVVEKCVFCHHRLKRIFTDTAVEGRTPADAELQHLPACAAACPALAMTFGDLNDPYSKVSELSQSPRVLRLLEHLGTKPNVLYLKRDRR